jgi:minor extracellular serine protease Vpr
LRRKRTFRPLVGSVLAGAVVALAISSAGVAADTPAALPDEVAAIPLDLQAVSPNLIVQLGGDPVALTGAGKSKAERNKLASELSSKQDAVRPAIQALGGRVLADYQWAYNGLKVQIDRSKIPQLMQLSGVTGVHAAPVYERTHLGSVPLLNGPAAWNGATGKTGKGVKIAIIDTGIDYTHANFDGPGTIDAFNAANATDTLPANPAHFGPMAPRVKGGTDLVGDAYDASQPAGSPATIPHPDPNPLDCNGHGSHVAGSAGGSGVLTNGNTYTGSYGADTFSTPFRIGPGVAPEAELYGVRVFGCLGSTDVVVEALDWAVQNGMHIVNMSLGLTFGDPATNPSAIAADNAAKAGVVVVTSAGNSGPSQFIGGTPGTATRTIATAANDSIPAQPGATLTLSTGGPTMQSINANGAPLLSGAFPIKVLRNPNGTVKRGCNHPLAPPAPALRDAADEVVANDYVDVAGKIVVVQRGTCARIARAIYGQAEGAAAVIMINNAAVLPPFEGPIAVNPDTGAPVPGGVTIPFLGVRGVLGTASDGDRLAAADGGTLSMVPLNLVNAGFKGFATFSSGGPRLDNSTLKPDITAPGVSILSTGVGSGSGGAFISGTSMASPHVAGIAALVRQAHMDWTVDEVKAAVVSTADPGGVTGTGVANYRTSRGGTGFANAFAAANTLVTAAGDAHTSSLSFGFEEVDKKTTFDQKKQIKLRNHGSQRISFDVTAVVPQGSAHSVQLEKTRVNVPGRGAANVDMRLIVPTATMGDNTAYREVAGLVKFTPVSGANGGIALHVPYLLVPRPMAHVELKLDKNDLKPESPTTTATVSNKDGTIASSADFYAWGLEDGDDGFRWNDVRAVGAQAFDSPTATDPTRRLLVFAVNNWRAWTHASPNQVNVTIDVGMNGTDDYLVRMTDFGLATTGLFDGQTAVAVFNLRTGAGSIVFLASAPTNSSTMLLPVRIHSGSAAARQLCSGSGADCLSAENPRFSYRVSTVGLRLTTENDTVPGTAGYNAWTSSISQGAFVPLAPNQSVDVPIAVNMAEWALTPAKGVMVVSRDNKNGQDEARTIEVKVD